MSGAQETITAVVRVLLESRAERQWVLAGALGLPDSSVSQRMRGATRWTSADLDALAAHFDVPLVTLLTDPSEDHVRVTSPYRAAAGQGTEPAEAAATLPYHAVPPQSVTHEEVARPESLWVLAA